MIDYNLEARYTDLPEGTTADCHYCGLRILLDQQEGGGPAKDWGAGCPTPEQAWSVNGGLGLDYGCGDHPANDDEGTWGHVPVFSTLAPPDSCPNCGRTTAPSEARTSGRCDDCQP